MTCLPKSPCRRIVVCAAVACAVAATVAVPVALPQPLSLLLLLPLPLLMPHLRLLLLHLPLLPLLLHQLQLLLLLPLLLLLVLRFFQSKMPMPMALLLPVAPSNRAAPADANEGPVDTCVKAQAASRPPTCACGENIGTWLHLWWGLEGMGSAWLAVQSSGSCATSTLRLW